MKASRTWFLGPALFLTLSVILSNHAQTDESRSQAFVDWAKRHAIPLKTVEAGHGFEDMDPLRGWLSHTVRGALGQSIAIQPLLDIG